MKTNLTSGVSNDLYSLLEKSLDNYSILFEKKGINLHIDILASKETFFDDEGGLKLTS